jgi:hypothetical protein
MVTNQEYYFYQSERTLTDTKEQDRSINNHQFVAITPYFAQPTHQSF